MGERSRRTLILNGWELRFELITESERSVGDNRTKREVRDKEYV